MKSILFCIPLKADCLDKYKTFAKETVKRTDEYRDMLLRYDIHSAKVWCHCINQHDYVFVYHKIGEDFTEKMQSWESSKHPFDIWFRENMNTVYDINNAEEMAAPKQLVDFTV